MYELITHCKLLFSFDLGLDGVVSDSQLPEDMQNAIMAHIEREEEILRYQKHQYQESWIHSKNASC